MAQIVAARLLRALGRLGWTADRQSGSHVVLVKAGRMHRGKTLKEGTARAILKQAGVSEEEFFDAY
jgi:predicted RNA binding protein YcfA (HicA-like mRNA interferase family)